MTRRPVFLKSRYRRCSRLAALVFILFSWVHVQASEPADWLPGLLERETITIVVTDSGLGGLSVVADAAVKFGRHPVFREIDLVFVNALFRDQGGYNSLQSRDEQLAVFSSALSAMHERYRPDLILVACNTLSVLAPDTAFARSGAVPVVGIVEEGVEQIAAQLAVDPNARNILFATRTTVEDGSHKQGLLDLGIDDNRLVSQACPQLSAYIEQGFDAMDTELLIDAYVDEALSQLGESGGPLSVSFNCTHFGYSLAAWKLAFESRGIEVAAYLDPNTRMVDFLLPSEKLQRYPASNVRVKAVSMVPIPAGSVDSIGRYLDAVSTPTAEALRHYRLEPGLFEWRGLVDTGAN